MELARKLQKVFRGVPRHFQTFLLVSRDFSRISVKFRRALWVVPVGFRGISKVFLDVAKHSQGSSRGVSEVFQFLQAVQHVSGDFM